MDRFAEDWRSVVTDPRRRALLAFAEDLTTRPTSIDRSRIEELRDLGLDEEAITAAVQVVAYFNYINRIAEGLGVHPEPWLDDRGRPLEELDTAEGAGPDADPQPERA